MITYEFDGKTAIITLLDHAGEIEDLEVSAEEGTNKLYIRQQWENEDIANVIVVSPTQADFLVRVLRTLLHSVPLETN